MGDDARLKTYRVVAYPEGAWWVFEMPELTSGPGPTGAYSIAVGQARTAADVAEEARLLAALWTQVSDAEVAVEVTMLEASPHA